MSIKNILIEMKNMSELMVDLAYSAVLFNSKDAAEEVLKLENKVNEDAEKLTALLEVAEAAESIANAAKDLADLVITGFKPHPVFKMVMSESDKMIVRVSVELDSDLANKTLGELLLVNRTGMRVIAIRRGDSWIYGPDKNTLILPDDTLLLKGTEAGADLLEKLASATCSLEDIPDELEEDED